MTNFVNEWYDGVDGVDGVDSDCELVSIGVRAAGLTLKH